MPDLSNVPFRTLRRQTGLVQNDLAFLLGFKDSSSVSRFERLLREPDFRTALMCEHVIGAPIKTLFAPLFRETGRIVRERAHARLEVLKALAGDTRHAARLTHLVKLAEQPQTLFDV